MTGAWLLQITIYLVIPVTRSHTALAKICSGCVDERQP
jgi:hypothetical protein